MTAALPVGEPLGEGLLPRPHTASWAPPARPERSGSFWKGEGGPEQQVGRWELIAALSQAGRSKPWSGVQKGCSSCWGFKLTTWPQGGAGLSLPLPPLSWARGPQPLGTRTKSSWNWEKETTIPPSSGGHRAVDEVGSHPCPLWSVPLSTPHPPNLHFNLTIPGKLQEAGPLSWLLTEGLSLSPSLSSAPAWARPPGQGQEREGCCWPGQGGSGCTEKA